MPHVTFDQPHTHAGTDYAAGDTLHVAPHVADWLIAQHVAHVAESPRARKPNPQPRVDDHAESGE